MDLDILSFWAMARSSDRVNASKKIEEAYTTMIAAQGDSKAMKKWLEPLRKKVDPEHNGPLDFLTSKYGGGF